VCGEGSGLTELRCGYHRWCWNLEGALKEVPSRKGFGAFRNEELPLIPVQVGAWGPLVFVNLDLDAEPLDEFLEGVPADAPWLGLADFHCTYDVSMPMPCNWKTVIDGFSETYHVQGIHREMLPCRIAVSLSRLGHEIAHINTWGLASSQRFPHARMQEHPDSPRE
jgi:phenylpropionate dioxygenase-like ring-hydroxylating dioxygenase large terminal subunit